MLKTKQRSRDRHPVHVKKESAPISFAVCSQCKCRVKTKRGIHGAMCPKGWKDFVDGRICNDCLHEKYIMRSFAFKIIDIRCDSIEDRDQTKKTFYNLLRHAYQTYTLCFRAAWDALIRIDTQVITQRSDKLKPLPMFNLYKEMSRNFLAVMPAGSISSICQEVLGKYKKTRLSRKVMMSERDVSYKFPQPIPIRNQDYHLECIIEEGVQRNYVHFSLRDPETQKLNRFVLQVEANSRNKKDPFAFNKQFAHLASDSGFRGEIKLMKVNINSHHDADQSERKPGGGNRKWSKDLIRISGYIPIPDWKPNERMHIRKMMILHRSNIENFLQARIEVTDKGRYGNWVFSMPRAMAWLKRKMRRQAGRVAIYQDQRQDRRFGNRGGHSLTARVSKQSDRQMGDDKNFIGRLKNEIINIAARENCHSIIFAVSDDPIQVGGEATSIPWFKLKTALTNNDKQINLLTVGEWEKMSLTPDSSAGKFRTEILEALNVSNDTKE